MRKDGGIHGLPSAMEDCLGIEVVMLLSYLSGLESSDNVTTP